PAPAVLAPVVEAPVVAAPVAQEPPVPPVELPVEIAADPSSAEAFVDRRNEDGPPYIGPERRSVADSTIRVDVELLDSLMNLVGELVLTRNQIVQRAASRQDTELLRTS